MLYDPKWKETKADPFAITNLIGWLETMPADREYCFLSHGGCLFAQYFTQMGFECVDVGGFSFEHKDASGEIVTVDLPDRWDDVAAEGGNTFGAALERARALAPND